MPSKCVQFDLVFSSRDDLSDRFRPLPQRSGCVIIADDDTYSDNAIPALSASLERLNSFFQAANTSPVRNARRGPIDVSPRTHQLHFRRTIIPGTLAPFPGK